MTTLTDDDLTHVLRTAADSYDVPPVGPAAVLAAAEEPHGAVPLRSRRGLRWTAAAAAVTAVAVAGGLLLQGGPTGNRTEMLTAAAPPAPSEEAAADVESGALSDLQLSYSPEAAPEALSRTTEQAPAAPVPAPAAAAPAQPGVQAPAPDGARVVKTGSLALIVEDGRVTPTLTAVQSVATGAGGLVQSAETRESGPTPSGTVVLRVPVARFEEVVTRVRSLDAEVRSATTAGRDVTAEYADVEAQLRTLRAARERFLEILAGTRSIGDVLAVQQRVDEVTGQIDRLEGQRAVLQNQSELATLEVTVTEADDPVVAASELPDDGLGQAFRDAWHGFTSGVEWLIAASGRALLVVLSVALLAVVLRLGWRIGRRRLV